MLGKMFHKGDKVLISDSGQLYTTHYTAIAQIFYANNVGHDTMKKFRFTKTCSDKELDRSKRSSHFVVMGVLPQPNWDEKNPQLVLIENKKHVYLIGNSGLIIDDISHQEPTQEGVIC
jgi:hypothetical protein